MKRKQGFTLIELLVVVLIIGILSAIALPQYQKAVKKADFAEAMLNLKTMGEAQQTCKLATGEDYCTFEEMGIDIGVAGNGGGISSIVSDLGRETKNFVYTSSPTNGTGLVAAEYKKEDVCICYFQDGHFELMTDDCNHPNKTSLNYFKLLNIPEENTACGCC
ncbi:MAG: type II secretion system protein [Elusimicrobiaceae bacterium]|nr:type II secretion system protein [Elusimicrobiaceae bacterium]